jgi:hypothetical protein
MPFFWHNAPKFGAIKSVNMKRWGEMERNRFNLTGKIGGKK